MVFEAPVFLPSPVLSVATADICGSGDALRIGEGGGQGQPSSREHSSEIRVRRCTRVSVDFIVFCQTQDAGGS